MIDTHFIQLSTCKIFIECISLTLQKYWCFQYILKEWFCFHTKQLTEMHLIHSSNIIVIKYYLMSTNKTPIKVTNFTDASSMICFNSFSIIKSWHKKSCHQIKKRQNYFESRTLLKDTVFAINIFDSKW